MCYRKHQYVAIDDMMRSCTARRISMTTLQTQLLTNIFTWKILLTEAPDAWTDGRRRSLSHARPFLGLSQLPVARQRGSAHLSGRRTPRGPERRAAMRRQHEMGRDRATR